MKKRFTLLMTLLLLLLSIIPSQQVNATTESTQKYITINDFVVRVLKATGYGKTYNDAIKTGIVTADQFANTSEYIVNQDVSLILDKTYTLLYGLDIEYERLIDNWESYVYADDKINFKYLLWSAKSYWMNILTKKNVNKYINYFREEVQTYIKNENYSAVADIEYLIACLKDKEYLIDQPYLESAKQHDDSVAIDHDKAAYVSYSDKLISAMRDIKGFDDAFALNYMMEVVKNNNRISDINRASKIYRESIYRMYAKGIMTGYNNGMFAPNRKSNPTDKALLSEVKVWINRLVRKSDLRLLAPDGQLIRTTDLPYNAKEYPYILQAFPNHYYSMIRVLTNESSEYFSGGDESKIGVYTPAKYQKNPKYIWTQSKAWKQPFLDQVIELEESNEYCMDVIKENLKARFNISYKNMNKNWINTLADTYIGGINTYSIDKYIKLAKKYKINLTADQIAVESTSNNGSGYRCYVKFTLTWEGKPENASEFIYTNDGSNIHYLKGLSNGKSIEVYFDIDASAFAWKKEGAYIQDAFLKGSVYSAQYLKEKKWFRTKPLKLVKLTNINDAYKAFNKMYGKAYADKNKIQLNLMLIEYGAVYYWDYN